MAARNRGIKIQDAQETSGASGGEIRWGRFWRAGDIKREDYKGLEE